MLKSLSLIFASSLLTYTAVHAQLGANSPVRIDTYEDDRVRSFGLTFDSIPNASIRTPIKGTQGNSRYYNYVDHLALNNGDLLSVGSYHNFPYLWFQPDIYSIYTDTVKDTVKLSSYGVVLHPFWAGWNDNTKYGGNELLVTSGDDYTIDSVRAYGYYGRNPQKPGVVDTLRFAFSYGFGSESNIPVYYYPNLTARYNTDTVFSAALPFDEATHTMQKPALSTGPNVVFREVLLHASDTGRTSFAIDASLLVPADNLFGVTVTFHSGELYTPYADTAYVSLALNPGQPYKYGMFRPLLVKEKLSGFPTYIKENYNAGQYRQLPESSVNLGTYSPLWSWSANNDPSGYQYPYIDVKLTCSTCKTLSTGKVPYVAAIGTVFPNPANGSVSIPVTLKTDASVELAITNTVGQLVEQQQLGTVRSNQRVTATINTNGYANGVYFVTAKANGGQMTSRFVVSH